MSQCVDPKAPYVPCLYCEKLLKTCERDEAPDGNYICPVHPDGVEMDDGNWICEFCYDLYERDI